jgi:hypothetical protein
VPHAEAGSHELRGLWAGVKQVGAGGRWLLAAGARRSQEDSCWGEAGARWGQEGSCSQQGAEEILQVGMWQTGGWREPGNSSRWYAGCWSRWLPAVGVLA